MISLFYVVSSNVPNLQHSNIVWFWRHRERSEWLQSDKHAIGEMASIREAEN